VIEFGSQEQIPGCAKRCSGRNPFLPQINKIAERRAIP